MFRIIVSRAPPRDLKRPLSVAKIPLEWKTCDVNKNQLGSFTETTMLQPGQPAPDFELPDADMNVVSLNDFRNRNAVVLYFYPHDGMPGCTMEAIDFSELDDEFAKLESVVVGVSMDDCETHGVFRDKHGLNVQLLADVEGEVCGRYGVLHEKELDGKKKMCIQRSTFIIDRKGRLQHVMYGVSARGHAAEVLDLVRSVGKCK
jgi:peroxiredoxin Q/BCP